MTQRDHSFLFAAVVGSGMMAKAADKSGADYLLALNAGRFRVQGASSLTCFLPVRSANDWVIEFAEREMLGRCEAPIFAGLSVSDPNLDIPALVEKVRALGFSGVCNFPSSTLIDGQLGALMEREGLGLARELELVEQASQSGLQSFCYVTNNTQAKRMVDAGATAICVNIGFTSGGTGVDTHLTLEAAASQIDRVLNGIPANVDKLCHGGPITSPEEALAVTRISGVQGFVAGSTLDRLPLEQTVSEVAKGFTAISSLSRLKPNHEVSRNDLVGSSSSMQTIRQELSELRSEDIPVMFVGESGTGKSRAALWLHEAGPSSNRQPVVVDCPALGLDEGGPHLLGKSSGPYGGAGGHRGALEQASGSTLILEEISALHLDHQGKLLKFADEKKVQRIGDHTIRNADARIVATTSKDLRVAIEQGTFREDLYFRLNGHEIVIPPLRERVDDIPELINYISNQLTPEPPKFSNAALRLMLEHDWPGNVRELSHAVGRAIRRAAGGTINLKEIEFLKTAKAKTVTSSAEASPVTTTLSERDWIAQALARNGFRRAQTAEELGMTTRTLYNKIKRYRL